MARQIIVIDAFVDTAPNQLTLSFVCWLTPPANRIVVLPNFTSAVPSTPSWGITAAELQALQNGTVVEQRGTKPFDLSGGAPTIAAMESALQTAFTAMQNALTGQGGSVAHVIGASWNGTAWTAGP